MKPFPTLRTAAWKTLMKLASPTATATGLDKNDKQLRLLHQSIGLFSSPENAGRIAFENETSQYAPGALDKKLNKIATKWNTSAINP